MMLRFTAIMPEQNQGIVGNVFSVKIEGLLTKPCDSSASLSEAKPLKICVE